MSKIVEILAELPTEHAGSIFGQFDAHAKKIERALQVTLIPRDGLLKIVGEEGRARQAEKVIGQLLELAKRGSSITEQNVNYALGLVMEESSASLAEIDKDCICHTIGGRPVTPKTLGQKNYVDAIRKNMIVFGVGQLRGPEKLIWPWPWRSLLSAMMRWEGSF